MLTIENFRLLSIINLFILCIPVYDYFIRRERKTLNYIFIFGGLSIWGLIPIKSIVQYWYHVVPLFLMFLVLNQPHSEKHKYYNKIRNLAYLYIVVFFANNYAFINNLVGDQKIEYFEFFLYAPASLGFLICGLNLLYRQHIALSLFLIVFSFLWMNFWGAYCMFAILAYLIHLSLYETKVPLKFSDTKKLALTIKSLIEADLKRYCNLTEICDEFNINEKRLRKIFRQHFKITPTQYIKKVRMKKLDEYIQDYREDVYKHTHLISQELGYSSQESMYKLIYSVTEGRSWKQYYTSKLSSS